VARRRVLVLCTANSARSQLAEGLIRHGFGDRIDVFSAGVAPSLVRPEAVAVMREIGIDISTHRSKHVSEFAGREFDDVITVCDAANEQCPIFPGHARRHHRDFKDPASTGGSEEQRLAAFRQTRDELRHWLTEILAVPT
jgi:arsenate reductase (thioredoxin)